ncbi:hypothetical protein [Micromonospora sp. NPDC000668]|uniref:hypothetical protein n=1 Tax=Micromonospora sp. NPDC000668 TaxID=3364219 RepID=UPI003680715E
MAPNSGLAFGTGGGHVRLNLATAPELITEAVRRMATADFRGKLRQLLPGCSTLPPDRG